MGNDLPQLANQILKDTAAAGIAVRLVGGLAISERCETFQELIHASRTFNDIDLASHFKDKRKLEAILTECYDFRPDEALATIPNARQSHFQQSKGRVSCDVYYDELNFCHRIDLSMRLLVDPVTIPLAELMLSKLQIVELNAKDL